MRIDNRKYETVPNPDWGHVDVVLTGLGTPIIIARFRRNVDLTDAMDRAVAMCKHMNEVVRRNNEDFIRR